MGRSLKRILIGVFAVQAVIGICYSMTAAEKAGVLDSQAVNIRGGER